MINTQGKERECGICRRAVIGDCMISSGKYYHKHCMTCSVCGDSLNGTYFTFLDKLICEKDYKVGLDLALDNVKLIKNNVKN